MNVRARLPLLNYQHNRREKMQQLIVSRLVRESSDVIAIELRDASGADLIPFTAGAHVDVRFPTGIVRQYSLCNDERERDRYCLGIALSSVSRGGSAYVHEQLQIGDTLEIGVPRSLFGIDKKSRHHVFVAGGIGITPILSMISWCEANGCTWQLLYCVRSRERAAYLPALSVQGEAVTLHIDDEVGAIANVGQYLAHCPKDSAIYCCGPGPLMDAIGASAQSLGFLSSALHFERFSAEPATARADTGFTVKLCRTGRELQIPSGKTVLEVLEENDISVPSSCREGLCRTCEVPVLGGMPEHNDYVLSDSERESNTIMLVCVSRAISEELELDL